MQPQDPTTFSPQNPVPPTPGVPPSTLPGAPAVSPLPPAQSAPATNMPVSVSPESPVAQFAAVAPVVSPDITPPQNPGVSPASTVPQVAVPALDPVAHSPLQAAKKKRMLTLAIIVIASLLVLGGMALFALKVFGSNIKLQEFSNDELSLLVPEGYVQKEQNGGMSFEENAGAKDTRSEVVAFNQKLPKNLDEKQIEQLRGTLKTMLEQAAAATASNDGRQVKNVQTKTISFKSGQALQLTADAVKDDSHVGTYTLVAGVTNNAVYMVGVGAHTSDPGLQKKADTIINSFTLR